MKYYKKIDVDWTSIQQEIAQWATTELIDQMVQRSLNAGAFQGGDLDQVLSQIPSLLDLFAHYELTPYSASMFVIPNETYDVIHVDNSNKIGRMVLPVHNCSVGLTKFFKHVGASQVDLVTQTNGKKAWYFDAAECEQVDSVLIDRPTFIRILEPHVVDCQGLFPRLTLLIDFEEKFNDYLEELIES